MHNHEFLRYFNRFARVALGVLPIFFWFSLMFSFDAPAIALTTLLAAVIHECGHFLAVLLVGNNVEGFRGTLSGFRIKSGSFSYTSEFLIYLGGPLANLSVVLVSSFFLFSEYAKALLAVNISTCISNLLPIEGYDGYGMIRCVLMKKGFSHFSHRLLGCISLSTVTVLCVLSLYLMDRCGEGYWIFFVFFFSMLKKMSNMLKDAKNEK